jgi:hypothetical protein
MAIRPPVYFNENIDGDLWEHAKQFGNFSAYVKKLIRIDLERGLVKLPKVKPVVEFPVCPPDINEL